MWIEDFSGVKALFDRWRSEGVEDIRAFLKEDAIMFPTASWHLVSPSGEPSFCYISWPRVPAHSPALLRYLDPKSP